MRNKMVFLVVIAVNLHSSARAENWPGWRGPRGDGTSQESGLPTKWSGTENVVWKTPIPGVGYSSPIVWGDHIFLTTAFAERKDRVLLCVDRKSGEIIWQKTVLHAPLESKIPQTAMLQVHQRPTASGCTSPFLTVTR